MIQKKQITFQEIRENKPVYYGLGLIIVAILQITIDKTMFEYAGKKAPDNFITYSYQLNRLEDEAMDKLKFIQAEQLRKKIDLDSNETQTINDQFNSDLITFFNHYQALMRKLDYLKIHGANLLNASEPFLAPAASHLEKAKFTNLKNTLKNAKSSFSWHQKTQIKTKEQQKLFNHSIFLIKMNNDGKNDTDLAVNNFKFLKSLFSDENSLLRRHSNPKDEIVKLFVASQNILESHKDIIESYNARVSSEELNKLLLQFLIILLFVIISIAKEISSIRREDIKADAAEFKSNKS